MFTQFTMDGITYANFAVSVTRQATIRSSDVSGYLLNKNYYNDVLGTYYEYTVKLAVARGAEADYTTYYTYLVAPVAEHTFILPFNQTEKTIKGRVSIVSDEYYGESNGVKYWRRTVFKIVSNEPDGTYH